MRKTRMWIAGWMLAGASLGSFQSGSTDLNQILVRSAIYCDRLARASLDFVCLERVDETIANLILEQTGNPEAAATFDPGNLMSVAKAADPGQPNARLRAGSKVRNSYVYDYQLVRDKEGQMTETRTLLRENGRNVMEKNAALKIRTFKYAYTLMGPNTLLGRAQQRLFDFAIEKETTLQGQTAVVVAATPKPGSQNGILSGKVWVRKDDFSVLKIEWVPESIGNYAALAEFAKTIGAEPRLTLSTEFAFEKNGIRFPSVFRIEEQYVRPSGPPVVRSTTVVTHTDYKFFTVETDTVIR